MRKIRQRNLLIIFSLLIAASVAYAAVIGVLTLTGTGTIGDVPPVSQVEFLARDGTRTVRASDITDFDGSLNTPAVPISPSDIVIDGDTVTFSNLAFPAQSTTSPMQGVRVNLRAMNRGDIPVDIAAPVTDMTITFPGVIVNGAPLYIRNNGNVRTSNNPMLADVNLSQFFGFTGDFNNNPGLVGPGLAPNDFRDFTFGLVMQAGTGMTNFGNAMGVLGVPGLALADATFSFSVTLDVEY
jgi:hypothetical protein